MGGKSRWLGASIALVTVLLLFVGADFIQFLPKVIVGGILLFIGISFLVDWLYETWFRLSKDEYLLIALIVIVIASIGFLEGVALGVLAAVAIFAVNYANIHPVENALSGKDFRSIGIVWLCQRKVTDDHVVLGNQHRHQHIAVQTIASRSFCTV